MSFVELPTEANVGPVACLSFTRPADDTLFVASYDRSILLYNCRRHTLATSLVSPAPVVSIAYSSYKSTFTGLLDGTIRHIDYENMAFSQPTVVSEASSSTKVDDTKAPVGFANGINCLNALDHSSSFVASTYGGKLLLFDPRAIHSSHQVQTSLKIFAMDASENAITLAKSQLKVEIYDSRKLATPVSVRSSGLRFQVTHLRNFPSKQGYALSSVDGRVSVEPYDELPEAQANKFAFKCHRSKDKVAGEDVVSPVTGLVFHPIYSTLFTAGGDGNVCIWNWEKRKRMKLFSPCLTLEKAISHMDVSAEGTTLAVSVEIDCYFRAKRHGETTATSAKLFVRSLSELDCKPKP